MLMETKTLQYLNISDNRIDDEGMKNVMEGLQCNDTLTGLRIHDCQISIKGNYSYLGN